LLFFCLIILFLTSAPNIVAEEKVVKTAGLWYISLLLPRDVPEERIPHNLVYFTCEHADNYKPPDKWTNNNGLEESSYQENAVFKVSLFYL
jgi:hypothetical protein